MKEAYIYRITNLINGRVYIGQHNGGNRHYYTGGTAIKRAIKKYGRQSFSREILVKGHFTKDELNDMETMAIIENKSFNHRYPDRGYNLTYGGEGNLGYIPSEQSRKLIRENSASRKNVMQFDLSGNHIKTFSSGPDVTRQMGLDHANINRACSGKVPHCGGYLWMFERDYLDGKRPLYEPLTGNLTRVAQYNFAGQLIAVYDSLVIAAKAIGKKRSSIANALAGFSSTAHGFQWREVKGEALQTIDPYDPRHWVGRVFGKISKEVIQYDLDGVEIARFPNSIIAGEKLGVHKTSITHCCRGTIKTAKGFVFRYATAPVRRNKRKQL